MLSMSKAEMLIHARMTSRLDYCNALFGGCSARLINKLQLVRNAAARVLTRSRKYDHISPVLSTLHWIHIKHRIYLKILLITYKALNVLAPQYLSELLSHYSPPRLLRSQNSGRLIIHTQSQQLNPYHLQETAKNTSLHLYLTSNSSTLYSNFILSNLSSVYKKTQTFDPLFSNC